MDRLFDDLFTGVGLATLGGAERVAFSPRIDVTETDKAIKVSAELPGLAKEDVTVDVEDEQVIIRGERKEEVADKDEKANWRHREVTYGSFYRSIPLTAAVNGEKARATFTNGVLKITLPKRREIQEKKRTLKID
jgi:HSP20 family protein